MELAWFAGIDWGSQTHQACVLDAAGEVLGERGFEHGGAGLAEMTGWLLSFSAGAAEVGVAIETPRGPVVESLMEHGFAVHSVNPKQLDRFRDRLSPAGAKDDRRDARVLASALRTDAHCFRRLEPTDAAVVELREWSRLSDDLTRERVRLANRMRQQLWRYYPQFLDAVGNDVAAPWALELWRRLPTPCEAGRVRETTLPNVKRRVPLSRPAPGHHHISRRRQRPPAYPGYPGHPGGIESSVLPPAVEDCRGRGVPGIGLGLVPFGPEPRSRRRRNSATRTWRSGIPGPRSNPSRERSTSGRAARAQLRPRIRTTITCARCGCSHARGSIR